MPIVSEEQYQQYKEKLQSISHAGVIPIKTAAGKEIGLNVSELAINKYGLSFFDSVVTGNGKAVVMGVANNKVGQPKLWFWYDKQQGVTAVSNQSIFEARSSNEGLFLPQELIDFIEKAQFSHKSNIKIYGPQKANEGSYFSKIKDFLFHKSVSEEHPEASLTASDSAKDIYENNTQYNL